MTEVVPDFSQVAPTFEREKVKEMLHVGQVDGKTVVRINSSSLGIILACGRKSYYTLFRQLRSRSEAPALIFGSAIHKAMEIFYSHPYSERSIPAGFKAASDMMAFGTPAPSDHFLYSAITAFVGAAAPLSALPDSDKRSIPNGIWILQQYFSTYINDPYVVYLDAAGPVVERTCETILFEDDKLRIILFGTIDAVLHNEQNGNILPADHKTFSKAGPDFFNRLNPNHQYTGYLVLSQRVLGLKTTEFMVNGLQVKPKPVTARGSGCSFTRQITNRSESDVREFIQTVTWAVRSYLTWLESSVWPMGHNNECSSFGGCQFREICATSAPQLRENLLDAKFQSPNN